MNFRTIGASLLAVACLVALAPTARADHGSRYRDGDRWQDAGAYRDGGRWQGDRSYRDDGSSRRTYYYEDPYCGLRSSHVSDFKRHYHGARHAPFILKVDIRSRRVIARYAYDAREQEWRDGDRGYGTRYDRSRGWRDGDRRGHGRSWSAWRHADRDDRRAARHGRGDDDD